MVTGSTNISSFYILQSICGTTNQCEESYLDNELHSILLLQYNFGETDEFVFDKNFCRK